MTVAGIDLVVEEPGKPKKTRILRDGEELPRDVWDNVLLEDADGQRVRLEVGYSVLQLSPTLRVNDKRDAIVLAPLGRRTYWMWIAFVVLGVVGFLTQGWFLVGGTYAAAAQLAQQRRQVVRALVVMVIGAWLQVLSWTGVLVLPWN